jgi:hypothetical protein
MCGMYVYVLYVCAFISCACLVHIVHMLCILYVFFAANFVSRNTYTCMQLGKMFSDFWVNAYVYVLYVSCMYFCSHISIHMCMYCMYCMYAHVCCMYGMYWPRQAQCISVCIVCIHFIVYVSFLIHMCMHVLYVCACMLYV